MKKFLSLLIILGAAFSLYAQNPNAPVMTFEKDTHEFGVLPEGPEATYDFEFTNTGKEPLVIRNCQGSCGCTKADWVKAPIAPGQKGKITVKYKTDGYPGDFKKTVYIQSNAKPDRERVEIYIRGSVTPKEKPATVDSKTGGDVLPDSTPQPKEKESEEKK